MRAPAAAQVRLWTAAVFGLALAARMAVVWRSAGGITGNVGYDQSVYYAAADALLSGRMPYRDFMLVHPPGLMLLLTPFAAVGRATNDLTGFVLADLAAALVGAVNAVLVVVIGRRFGLSMFAAGIGGLFYAVWWGVVSAEYSARLEPFGNLFFLVGVAALLTPPSRARRWPLLAGVALTVAASIKIWWALPELLLLGWRLTRRDGHRAAALAAAGAVGCAVVVDGPFLAAAPSSMWHMVVLDQLGRPPMRNRTVRIDTLATVDFGARGLVATANVALLLGAAALALVLLVCAWRVAPVRPLLIVALAEFGLLMVTPRYYSYYGAFLGPALALVVAAAAHSRQGRWRPRLGPAAAGLATVAVAASTAVGLDLHAGHIIPPFPRDRLADAVGGARCVMSDSQMALIELDVLTRDLNRNCPDWVDVVGRTYGPDAVPGHPQLSRYRNPRWQRDLRRYLLSGQAVIRMYPLAGLDAAGRRAIDDHPVLASAGGYTLYGTIAPARRSRTRAPDAARSATEDPSNRGTPH